MKNCILIISIFCSFSTFGQVTLEGTYANGYIGRAVLEESGEKYFVLDTSSTAIVRLFNADHTPWKNCFLPVVSGAAYTSLHISDNLINDDDKVEFIYSYYIINSGTLEYTTKIINESGAIILTMPGVWSAYISNIAGLPNKLIAYLPNNGSPKSEVYGLPSIGTGKRDLESGANNPLIYPNPASSTVNIGNFEAKTTTIHDINGKLLKTGNTSVIDISDLKTGTYIISGKDSKTGSFSKKLIVN